MSATARSAPDAATTTVADAVLFAAKLSTGFELTVALSVMLAPPVTCTTVVKVVVVPLTRLAIVHVNVVVPEQLHPAAVGAVTELVFAGRFSV
jgi:hypothetical protein